MFNTPNFVFEKVTIQKKGNGITRGNTCDGIVEVMVCWLNMQLKVRSWDKENIQRCGCSTDTDELEVISYDGQRV